MSSTWAKMTAMAAESYDRWMPAWLSLVRTHARLWDQVEAQMREDHGLTMARYDVLASLANAGGRLGLSDLASSILLSQSGLSKLLDRMERSGLVHRDPDPRDARAAFATLTPRGRSMARQARQMAPICITAALIGITVVPAHDGGSARDYLPDFAWFGARL